MDKILEQYHHPEKVSILEGGQVEIAKIEGDMLIITVKTREDEIYLLRLRLPISISRIRRIKSG